MSRPSIFSIFKKDVSSSKNQTTYCITTEFQAKLFNDLLKNRGSVGKVYNETFFNDYKELKITLIYRGENESENLLHELEKNSYRLINQTIINPQSFVKMILDCKTNEDTTKKVTIYLYNCPNLISCFGNVSKEIILYHKKDDDFCKDYPTLDLYEDINIKVEHKKKEYIVKKRGKFLENFYILLNDRLNETFQANDIIGYLQKTNQYLQKRNQLSEKSKTQQGSTGLEIDAAINALETYLSKVNFNDEKDLPMVDKFVKRLEKLRQKLTDEQKDRIDEITQDNKNNWKKYTNKYLYDVDYDWRNYIDLKYGDPEGWKKTVRVKETLSELQNTDKHQTDRINKLFRTLKKLEFYLTDKDKELVNNLLQNKFKSFKAGPLNFKHIGTKYMGNNYNTWNQYTNKDVNNSSEMTFQLANNPGSGPNVPLMIQGPK